MAWTTCFWEVVAHPWWSARRFALWVVGTVLFGFLMLFTYGQYRAWIEPGQTEILADPVSGERYRLEPRELGGYWLDIDFRVPEVPGCVKEYNQYLFKKVPSGDKPIVVPLNSGSGGGNNPSPLGTVYTLKFFLAIGFPGGDWYFQNSARLVCEPAGMFVYEHKTKPVLIHIPEG
jgi:hypothetical protein